MKYIILTHGFEVWNIKNKYKLIALKNAYRIISVSRYTISRIKEQIIKSAKEVFLLPNTIDTTKFKPDKKAYSLIKKYNLNGYKIILTVSRLDYADRDKGYDKVILALPKVIKTIPKIKYFLVGRGDDIPRIQGLMNNLWLKEYVILPGFISSDELVFYYNLCDLFIMPSKQEGFGIVFLEALACGKPVIAGNQDGSRDALLDGKLGLLVNPDDVNQIAEAIVKILEGNVDSRLLDANFLRQSVIENFGLERFQQKVSETLGYISSDAI